MNHGRTSAGGSGAVHALSRAGATRPGRPWRALCGMLPTSPPDPPLENDGRFTGHWHRTPEPVTCGRCLARLERLAEQALADDAAITLVIEASRRAPADRVRSFRQLWPVMGRAVADLLRHRDVALGDGWLGPAGTKTVRTEGGVL
jgi:hypothetical protein